MNKREWIKEDELERMNKRKWTRENEWIENGIKENE